MLVDMNCHSLDGRLLCRSCPRLPINEVAAEFLRSISGKLSGAASVRIPEGLGQVIMPDGSIVPTNWATVVPKPGGGYRTGYPVLNK
jgi:hypothetical protein